MTSEYETRTPYIGEDGQWHPFAITDRAERNRPPCRCKAPFWPRWDDAEDRVEHMPNRCPLGFQDPPEEIGKAGSEYETRMAQCRASGHELVPWHIRFFGALYVRLWCTRCSLTFLPVTGGR